MVSDRCNPNGQFYMNGLLCQCNSDGTWTEANCRSTYKRRICSPGIVTFKDCSRCVCQDNGQYLCSYIGCDKKTNPNNFNSRKTEINVLLDIIGTSCVPFKSYYVNCNICFCPPSGKSNEAQCSRDESCTLSSAVPSTQTLMKTSCVPKLIYSYPCLQCPCTDQGRFNTAKCVNTCSEKKLMPVLPVQCTPKSFYKIKCNVCFCPTNGIPDPKYCSKKKCTDDSSNTKMLRHDDLPQPTPECTPYTFTEKRCFYCTCNPGAIVNENHCLEVECELIEESEYTAVCTPDEMYPICAECYCYRANLMDIAYCTKRCSQENKAAIFKKVLNDSTTKVELLDSSEIQDIANKTRCEPNSLFKSNNKTCLCPETSIINQQYCGFVGSANELPKEKQLLYKDVYKVNITFNASCSPSTFVRFDCNVCYCTRDGKIDPKWCTYDDCETLQKIQDSRENPKLDETEGETCIPGLVSRKSCNLCLCPQSGLAKDRICSRNPCDSAAATTNLKLDILCKPTAYFKVDCNVCLCPKDGVKNLESCSKHNCERNALRTVECEPGKLFSDECNICICPVSGRMNDKICTTYACSFGVNADKNVLASSQQLLDQFEAYTDHSRTLDPCYPEEEFVQGCKLCICPDMGLKQYATCTTMLCDPSQNVCIYIGAKIIRDNNLYKNLTVGIT